MIYCYYSRTQPHRVVSPSDEAQMKTVRQSIGFFVHPDHDVLMKCIDGSDNYPVITAKEATDRIKAKCCS
jgi:isopenicillin N synthase-like dioxygenase